MDSVGNILGGSAAGMLSSLVAVCSARTSIANAKFAMSVSVAMWQVLCLRWLPAVCLPWTLMCRSTAKDTC
jgi:hypothetical protein